MSIVRKDIENFRETGWPHFYKVTLTIKNQDNLYDIFAWLHETIPYTYWLYKEQDFKASTATFLMCDEDSANLTFWMWSQ